MGDQVMLAASMYSKEVKQYNGFRLIWRRDSMSSSMLEICIANDNGEETVKTNDHTVNANEVTEDNVSSNVKHLIGLVS